LGLNGTSKQPSRVTKVFASVVNRCVTDRQTDKQTHDNSIYHTSIASFGKKLEYLVNDALDELFVNISYLQFGVYEKLVFVCDLTDAMNQ